MTIPDRRAAAALLLELDPPAWFLRHACAVAEIGAFLAARMATRGIVLDRQLVEAAGLLHDVDKLLPADDPARALPHGDASGAWLAGRDHGELARAVAGHPVTRLVDETGYERWSALASREERIVAYADKRAGQRLESMAERFLSWNRRYPGSWDVATAERAWSRAVRLEADVCRAAGVTPAEVRRLAWARRALASAR